MLKEHYIIISLAKRKFFRALVLVAEVVVVARHQMDGVIPLYQNFRDKIVPSGGPHLVVKGDHEDLLDAVQPPHQVPPVLGGVDEGTGDAGEYFFRYPVKGEYRGDSAPGGEIGRASCRERV